MSDTYLDQYGNGWHVRRNGILRPRGILRGAVSMVNSGALAVTSMTVNHTIGNLPNRLLLLGVATNKSATASYAPSGVTHGGVALTKLIDVSTPYINSSLWYLVAPATGTYPLVISLPTTLYAAAVAVELSGVHQVTPFGSAVSAVGSGTNMATAVSCGVYDLVVDMLAKLNSTETPAVNAGKTQVGLDVSGSSAALNVYGGLGSAPGVTGGSVTMGWNWPTTARAWAQVAVPVKPA